MKTEKDLQRINKCIRYLNIKAIDYGIPSNNIPNDFYELLTTRVQLYGNCLDLVDKHIMKMLDACLEARGLPLNDDTAITALKIISKNCREFMKLTDTHPNIVLLMRPKELFEVVESFEEDANAKKIAAYALGQYIVSCKGIPKEPPEHENSDDNEDWIDLEEEEDDENQFINDEDEYV